MKVAIISDIDNKEPDWEEKTDTAINLIINVITV